ncbi:MAG TPA: TetR/AcrR family transcriptional regulator [Pseudonocardiaceae bacterium]|jgi:AcrR family transcriptional regulator|nr:TetR/AcrR family transcriptional regulator [Pseudonocardiaceae bacterium]
MPKRADTADRQPPTGARAEAKQQAIIEAARSSFLAEGFDASMDRIAAAADVSKATVYNHFGSKEALFIAVVGDELDRALAEPAQLVESRLAASTHLYDDMIQACRLWVAGIATPQMIALRNLVTGEQRRFPDLGAAWHERGPQRFHPVIADALHRLVERRQLSIDDVDLAVLQLSGLVVSPNLVYGGYGSPPDNELVERLIIAGVDMFLDHYRYRARM